MTSQTMLAGMKFSCSGTQISLALLVAKVLIDLMEKMALLSKTGTIFPKSFWWSHFGSHFFKCRFYDKCIKDKM